MGNFFYHTDQLVQDLTRRLEQAIPVPWVVDLIKMGLAALLLVGLASMLGMVLIWIERKVAAHMQQRLGPMRVGPHGIFQTVADTLKLLAKEDLTPKDADQFVYNLAPLVAFAASFTCLALVEFSPGLQAARFNVGLLFLVGISSVGVLGLLAAGWSSNNKWSMLGAMRAGAQIISYELSAALALVAAIIFTSSLDFHEIVESQRAGWWIWRAPVVGLAAFVIYTIASTAECNRTPFDIAEGESELVAGFHTEYGAMKFAMFFLAEFINVFLVSAVSATVFLGGWMPFHIGGMEGLNRLFDVIPPWLWFFGKVSALIFVVMWFRWTFPRLRVDQLMTFEWKFLMPVALATVAVAAVLVTGGWFFFSQEGVPQPAAPVAQQTP
ncbi:MAG: NADH-quinone oxidoreductase subunit NuoH [Verrucomicrobia bacterium]|nr:NADH-quinone oxidoreductase subunit NuoH [Verrucomicrobiota bacterium]